jgi:mannose-6-phosphate isomerase-like protein (cupin superfamily)
MTGFETTTLATARTERAPDGSRVRALLRLEGGSMAQFELAPGRTSIAVMHRTIDEIWTVVSGYGELWRRHGAREAVVPLEPGVCLTIPAGTHFQFRATGAKALCVIGVSMPPWPGEDEATVVQGRWKPTVPEA